jgi:hypothetical protein
MALTGIDITDLTTSNPADIDGSVLDQVFTTAETTAGPADSGNNSGTGFGTGAYRLDDDADANNFTYTQSFRGGQTHPDVRFGDGTVQLIWTNLGDNEQDTTTITNTTNNTVVSPSGLANSENFKYGFTVTGMEEGTNLNISYILRCSTNGDTAAENFNVTVPSITGLFGADFQAVSAVQRVNQRLNGRDAATFEFSSFKRMFKDIAKKK